MNHRTFRIALFLLISTVFAGPISAQSPTFFEQQLRDGFDYQAHLDSLIMYLAGFWTVENDPEYQWYFNGKQWSERKDGIVRLAYEHTVHTARSLDEEEVLEWFIDCQFNTESGSHWGSGQYKEGNVIKTYPTLKEESWQILSLEPDEMVLDFLEDSSLMTLQRIKPGSPPYPTDTRSFLKSAKGKWVSDGREKTMLIFRQKGVKYLIPEDDYNDFTDDIELTSWRDRKFTPNIDKRYLVMVFDQGSMGHAGGGNFVRMEWELIYLKGRKMILLDEHSQEKLVFKKRWF